ncbi:HAD family hydrolase [Paenibacillus sinopodophylli]|uniref:HAD family hydrolase n=1 Tax=Paenibacillus sinopodophylli TaxID=1837342 RepID=UPI00110D2035|nr:HAD family hydrolase [Paenibacillus sinopodophylli]
MGGIDTVIFDLDQTLLNKDQSLINFAKYQYARFSLHQFITEENEFIEKFTEYNNIVMPKEDVYRKLINIFNLESTLYSVLLEDLNNNFHLYSIGFPGLNEMLCTLKQRGYKLGMITNGREFFQRNKMISLGIMELFDDIVISEAVNLRKPDHAIFRLSLSNLNSLAERSVFIGDNLKADIVPSKEMGMRTIFKSKDISSSYPDATCDDLTEIPKIINAFQKLSE